ncbi:Dual specificity protein kinase TTK-like protein [Aphelenchoides bicaudatus]|nr:Dual specificity protein kinase TTK-like protein [Aphelenchoides bicaudatus]
MISSDMMTPSLPIARPSIVPPIVKPTPIVPTVVPEPKPVVPTAMPEPKPVVIPQIVNPAVEALKLTPKRRASIIIQKKPPTKPQQGKLKRNDIVRLNKHEYRIECDIGSGGSCVVYKARVYKAPEVNKSREWVALKIVDLTNADRELKKIFENEIQFLEKLQDSSFVITIQRVQDKLYVVMELGERNFKGADENIQGGRSTRRICAQILLDSDASMYIVHADLKPANFVLVNSLLKLIDFGIAAQIVADETTVYRKGVQGTLNYISPEAVSCRPNGDGYEIPLKSDVWSLGCILYALVYGEPPFAHIEKQDKKLWAIMNEPITFRPRSASGSPCCLIRDIDKRSSVQELLRHRYVTNMCK